jgi:ABC-2 type transport system permease protein
MFNPMVFVVGLILLAITYLNAAGGVQDLQVASAIWNCDGFVKGFSQIYYNTIFICCIMAAYIGVTSISGERNNGCLNILLTKPLYRRDVVMGKFIGTNLFLLVFLVIVMLANSLFLLNFYGAPSSVYEFLWRITIYTMVLSMELSLVTGITMLIGIIFKDLLLAVSIIVLYLSYEWFWIQMTAILSYMLNFPITSNMLTQRICGLYGDSYTRSNLFITSIPFSTWIGDAYPYIFLMVFLIVGVLLLNCLIYARMEDV